MCVDVGAQGRGIFLCTSVLQGVCDAELVKRASLDEIALGVADARIFFNPG